MRRDSERAAMIYLRGSDARQHEIADSLSKLARAQLNRGSQGSVNQADRRRSGTQPETSLVKIISQPPD